MRAPPESLRPMTGAPTFIAWSITLQIFSACASESEPPKTVKSWLKTKTRRPFADVPALRREIEAVVAALPREEKLAFLRAHPDLAGKAARADAVTEHS